MYRMIARRTVRGDDGEGCSGVTGRSGSERSGAQVAPQDPLALPPYQRERWARIVDAASELLAAGDYDTIQVRDVAARAGMALGTVYRYFPSKEQLYAVVLREWSAADAEARTATPDPALPPGERLRARMHHSVHRLHTHPSYLRLQLQLQQSSDPQVRGIFDQFSAQVIASYRGLIGDLPAADRDDLVAMASALLVHQLAQFAQRRQSIDEVHRLVDRFIDLVFGDRPGAGRR